MVAQLMLNRKGGGSGHSGSGGGSVSAGSGNSNSGYGIYIVYTNNLHPTVANDKTSAEFYTCQKSNCYQCQCCSLRFNSNECYIYLIQPQTLTVSLNIQEVAWIQHTGIKWQHLFMSPIYEPNTNIDPLNIIFLKRVTSTITPVRTS